MAAIESVRIPGPTGLDLAGILHHPRKGSSDTVVVVAHGMLSSKDSDKHRSICEAAAAVGATAVRFDFRGRGESEGDPSILTVSNEIEDFAAVIADVHHRGFTRVIAIGSSLGGTVAILSGAADRCIAGLVTIAAPSRLPEQPREAWGGSQQKDSGERIEVAPGEFIDAEFFRDAQRHDVVAAAHAIDCPWLIIHGAADPVVPVEDAELLAANGRDANLIVHPSAGHRFDQPEEREWLIGRVVAFLGSRL